MEVEGFQVVIIGPGSSINPGDYYIGKRNSDWRIGVCKFVKHNSIFCEDISIYPYNTNECYRIEIVGA